MIRPQDQTPEATLEALGAIWPIVYPAIEGAVHQALDFFGDDDVDRPLFPNLVRYHVKVALNSGGLIVVEDDEPRLQHSILSNNGLLLVYGDRRIRIRKADHGELPGPGGSETLRRFYQQQLTLIDDGEDVAAQNLMLLWDVRGSDVDLRLACPKGGEGHRAWAHWMVAVPHPAETYEAPQTQDDSFEFDVPITLPEIVADEE